MNLGINHTTFSNIDFSVIELLFRKFTDFFGFVYVTYLSSTIGPFLPLIKNIFSLLSVLLLALIIFILFKFSKLTKEDNKKYLPIDVKKEEEQKDKIEWEIILNHLDSENQAEWKLAIIEADSILDDILKKIGYEGETLADRLKSAGDGEVVQQAWEAHKIRNMIAHKGGTEITHREAKRVIELYRAVFKKFGYI